MELSFSHSHNQRILRQRTMLAAAAAALAAITIGLFLVTISRDREVVLQPVLRSPLTVSSAGVSREYLEMITRDTVVLPRSEEHPSDLKPLLRISSHVFS